MAIILDTNCFSHFFSRTSSKREEFEPVNKWVIEGKGFLIYGGSQYYTELRAAIKYLPIFRELKNIGKAIELDKAKVDSEQKEVAKIIPDEDFDDKHLAAIVRTSKCILICSEDKNSIKYVTDTRLYPKGTPKPKYYTGKGNANLLCDNNVHSCLKPLWKLNKSDREKIIEKMK